MFEPNRFFALGLVACLATSLSGCYSEGESNTSVTESVTKKLQTIEVAKSEKTRNLIPQISAADLSAHVTGNTDFALALFGALLSSNELAGKNIVFSPYGISLTVAMLSAGAANNTLVQIKQALRFPSDPNLLHNGFNSLSLTYESRNGNFTRADNSTGSVEVAIANALWAQKGYPFQTTFLDTLAVNYGAGVYLLDFEAAPDSARLTINDWAAVNTKNRIKEAMPEGSITDGTRLVLTNTVYFKGAWSKPFLVSNTANGDFTRLDSTKISTPFMHANLPLSYAITAGVTSVELPFVGGKLSLVVVMPDVGTFSSFAAGIDSAKVASLLNGLQPGSLDVTLPKFEFQSELPLATSLQALGLTDAFTDFADFSGIDGRRELQIMAAVHKAFVTVDESGAEATAFTGVVTGITSAPQSVVIDKPFVFLIRDVETKSILFFGRVLDPSQK